MFNQKQLIVAGVATLALLVVYLLSSGQFSLTQEGDGPTQPTTPTDEERSAVLTPPASENLAEYEATVERLAKESSMLTIGANCVMDPLALKLAKEATITLENIDTVPHTVAFENGGIFVLAPNYKKELKIADAFSKGVGTHRYRCDDISHTENVGALYVVK